MNEFGFIKVAAVSPRVSVANPTQNAMIAYNEIFKLFHDGVQVAVFPELFLSGYTCEDLFFQEKLIDECEKNLELLIKRTQNLNIAVVMGVPVRKGFRLYNCAAVFKKGSLLGVVPKMYLPNYNEFYEKRWFTPGTDEKDKTISLAGRQAPFGSILFEFSPDCVAGIEICEDMWVPFSPGSKLALGGANVILNLSASNEIAGKDAVRLRLVRQLSEKNICAYVLSNAGLGESTSDLVFGGACTIAENGALLSEGERCAQNGSKAVATIDVKLLCSMRRSSCFADNAAQYASEDIIRVVSHVKELEEKDITRSYSALPFLSAKKSGRSKLCRETLLLQSNALAKRLTHTGLEKVILGISGGLDSTLALLVCVRTMKLLNLPLKNILCVTMPGPGTSTATLSSAIKLINMVGGKYFSVDINDSCIQHMRDIGHDMNIHDTTYENAQARERTQILMDMANKHSALLVGTGDLSELALGWCTYNGDHMSMYNVNCSVSKTLVRALVAFEADNTIDSALADILRSILATPVSPELLPPEDGKISQKTEDVLGPYEVHDFYLYYFSLYGFSPEKLLFAAKKAFDGAYSEDELKKYLSTFLNRFFASQFKRTCVPNGPKVGPVSLSPRGDWRMASDVDVREWLDGNE